MKLFRSYFILFISLVLLASCRQDSSFDIDVTRLDSPAASGSKLPGLETDESGNVFLNWVELNDEKATLRYSRLGDVRWQSDRPISSGSNWFINWADFPALAAYSGKVVAAHWLVDNPAGTFAYDIHLSLASGNGWSEPITPHDDATDTEHGFVTMIPLGSDTVFTAWLDGRKMGTNGHGESTHENHQGDMMFRSAVIHRNGSITDEKIIDERVCECCQTTGTRTTNGLILAYRDRSSDEFRNIWVARHINGSWEEPYMVHDDRWQIMACPVNGPALDSDGDNVVLAWYTAPNNTPRVNVAFSSDEAASFSDPIRVDEGNPIGRVDVVMLDSERAVVSWIEKAESTGNIIVKLVSRTDGVLASKIVSEVETSRRSGFPKIAGYRENIVLAWTDYNKSVSKVKTALLKLQ